MFQCGSSDDTFEARLDSVDDDSIKSCGCRKHFSSQKNAYIMGKKNQGKYKEDIAGQKFGELTVIRPTDERDYDGNILWECRCSCGNKEPRLASYKALRTGHVKYCKNCNRLQKAKKYVGKKFGKLTILSIITDKNKRASNGGLYCKAICDCDKNTILEIPLGFIIRKNGQRSCGKCTISKGEDKIKQILQSKNIAYSQQESFDKAMRLENSNGYCKVDFYLPNQKIAIEYNGEQHYIPIDYFGGEKGFRKTQERYNLKKDYCKNHGIAF